MEQVEDEKKVDQRNRARGGRGVTINLVVGGIVRKVKSRRRAVSRNLLEEKRVRAGERERSEGEKERWGERK